MLADRSTQRTYNARLMAEIQQPSSHPTKNRACIDMHTGQMQPEKLPGAKTEAVPQGLLCTGKEAQVFPEVIEVAIRIAEHSKVFHAGSCRSLIQE
jgi:hypothetical protein